MPAIKLYLDKNGRHRVQGKGRYASKEEIAQYGGPGNDVLVVAEKGGKVQVDAPRRRSGGHPPGSHPGNGTSAGALISTETVTRIRTEAAADFLAGFLDGLAARASAQTNVLQEAAEFWSRAHPVAGQTRQGIRDQKQYDLGYTLGNSEATGYVALHLGWTPATWAAVAPRELAAAGAVQSDGGGNWLPDGAAEAIGGTVGAVGGGAVGSVVEPGGGTVIGGVLGEALGQAIGGWLGGESPNAPGGGGMPGAPQLGGGMPQLPLGNFFGGGAPGIAAGIR